ncbi:MAG: DMT family transporter [Candidatus Tectomicrobia bacterium]|nr:DMT family transporter [Candidatus Tectomicrobia bacterium]
MSAPVFALLAAGLIGLGEFSAHFGLRRVRPLTGVFLGTCYQLLTLVVVLVLRGVWVAGEWPGPALFFLVGILHPGAYFLALLTAIDRLGPARAITGRGTSPFFGVALAVLFLAERPNLQVYLGLVLIAGGVMVLSAGKGGKEVRRGDWAFALLAAFFSGLAPAVTKVALGYGSDPVAGVLFSIVGGMVSIVIANTVMERRHPGPFWVRTIPSGAYLLFLPMGVLTGLAYIAWFVALSLGTVSVVLPLVQSSPFVAILLSRTFLQAEERVDPRLILSALAIVTGAVLVTLGRA